MTSYQPAGVETALHPLRPIAHRLTWDDKSGELGTRVSNAPFERNGLMCLVVDVGFFVIPDASCL